MPKQFILKILQKKSQGFLKSRNNHTKEIAKNFTVSILRAKMSFLRVNAETGNEISCRENIFVRFSCQNLPRNGRHFPAFTNPIIFLMPLKRGGRGDLLAGRARVWCGAPALVVVVLKLFALRFSTLTFSTFLIV